LTQVSLHSWPTPVEARLVPSSKKLRHHTGRSPVDLLFSLLPLATPVEARLVFLLCSRHTGRSPVGTSPGSSVNPGWKLPSPYVFVRWYENQGPAHPGHKHLPATRWSADPVDAPFCRYFLIREFLSRAPSAPNHPNPEGLGIQTVFRVRYSCVLGSLQLP
jgi:hypothetical protein